MFRQTATKFIPTKIDELSNKQKKPIKMGPDATMQLIQECNEAKEAILWAFWKCNDPFVQKSECLEATLKAMGKDEYMQKCKDFLPKKI